MSIDDEIRKAQAELVASGGELTADERAALARQEELTKIRRQIAERRAVTLDGYVSAAKEALGPAVPVEGWDAEAASPGLGLFVIRKPTREASKAYLDAVDKAARRGRGERNVVAPNMDMVERQFARTSTHSWNGKTEGEWTQAEATAFLDLLNANPLALAQIMAIANELGGLGARASKS